MEDPTPSHGGGGHAFLNWEISTFRAPRGDRVISTFFVLRVSSYVIADTLFVPPGTREREDEDAVPRGRGG